MIIYWTGYAEEDTVSTIRFQEPVSLLKTVNKIGSDFAFENKFQMCPAFRDFHKSIYELKFPVTYRLDIIKNADGSVSNLKSSVYDQKFYDEMIYPRSPKDGLYSFNIRYLFFCDEDLEVTQMPAFFTENTFANSTMLISGKFNIGKWFRPFDCAFFLKSGYNSININEGDTYCYVQFNTENPIEFKRFHRTDKIKELQLQLFKSRSYRPNSIAKLTYYYDLYKTSKIQKLIKQEIEKNIME